MDRDIATRNMSKGKAWFYHFAIAEYDKAIALRNYVKYDRTVSFLLHISGSNISVCRCSIIRGKLEKNLLFQETYLTSYSRKRICQNRLPKCE